MPAIARETRAALALVQSDDLKGAARILDALIEHHPELGLLHANRAALAMLAGDTQAALAGLEAAAAHGFEGLAAQLADPLFAPRIATLLATAAPVPSDAPRPVPITAGRAMVSAANILWNPATGRLEPRFALPPVATKAILPDRPKDAAREILREHARRGRVAGNHGDLYDNRDRGHSRLEPAAHPQLAHIAYAPAARAAQLDYGLNEVLLFDRPTFGNSSTAITVGPGWRSLPRLALTQADGAGPLRLWQNAAANHLYVYPSHKDYTDKRGDLFPANTPYTLISRGSSGSDKPFLEAIAMILAAFRPETKARLIAESLIVPTVQMVFRRSLQNVQGREDYFSGKAHPAAYEAYNINLARMVSLANSIEPGDIPVEVRIRMVRQDTAREGVDYFGQGLSEELFDTPGAIGRIWRSSTWRRTMIVSAEQSRDANGRPLEFHWRLLQGDPERVRIEPLGDGARARITLDWHNPFTISEENPLRASRVDIGVFAHNGVHDSAPAIVSWTFPAHEKRRYVRGPDGAMRIASIDHAAPDRTGTYADPMLMARGDWRDDFHYDKGGALTGWTRHREDQSEDFTAKGARILERDAQGAPLRTEPVAHELRRTPEGRLVIDEIPPPEPCVEPASGVRRPKCARVHTRSTH